MFPNNEVFIYDTVFVSLRHFSLLMLMNFTSVFFDLIVNFECVRKKIVLLKIDFLNFMVLNEVMREN
jgi:hypothetical protein